MSRNSQSPTLDRRSLLAIGAGSIAVGSMAMLGGLARADTPAPTQVPRTPDLALSNLQQGNARFISQPQECVMDLAKQRTAVAGGQAPWATILGCADSRVPPEDRKSVV